MASPQYSALAVLLGALLAACAVGNTNEALDAAPTFDAVSPQDTGRRDASFDVGMVVRSDSSMTTDTAADDAGDAGASDGASDTGMPGEAGTDAPDPTDAMMPEGGCPPGTGGPGCMGCATGFHMCTGTCTADVANSPDQGCSQSCGNVCQPPANGTNTCTPDGQCSFVCNPNFTAMGSTCVSTGGQCNNDSDCAGLGFANTTCVGDMCTGCEPNFGDCDGNPADGCETDLSSTDNCGACGNSCCGSFCGCASTLFVGPESCNGPPFSCGC